MGVGPGMVRLQITVAERVVERLAILASDAGMTKSQYITMLVNQNWKEDGHAAKSGDGE